VFHQTSGRAVRSAVYIYIYNQGGGGTKRLKSDVPLFQNLSYLVPQTLCAGAEQLGASWHSHSIAASNFLVLIPALQMKEGL
jgi:hypothetical protein